MSVAIPTKGTVLLVEDERDTRDVLAAAIGRAGYHGVTAADVKVAIEKEKGSGFRRRRRHRHSHGTRAPVLALVALAATLLGCDGYSSHHAADALAFAGAAGALAVASNALSSRYESSFPQDDTLEEDDAAEYVLHRINDIRVDANVPPLVLDADLSDYAEEGSDQLARDHRVNGHLRDDPRIQRCGEAQGDPAGWPPASLKEQIDEILDTMMREGPGGSGHDNLVAREWRFLGVGIASPDARLYFTLDFVP
jgi:CheY-like chemotaxis protein